MGFSWRKRLPKFQLAARHACFSGAVVRLDVSGCLLFGEMALFQWDSQEASVSPKTGPTRAILGKAENYASFLLPRIIGSHWRARLVCLPVSRHVEATQHRFVN